MSLARLRRPDRQRLLLALALPLLLARLLVPPGFMPVFADGAFRLVLCPMQGALPATQAPAAPHDHHAQHTHHDHFASTTAPTQHVGAHDGPRAAGEHGEAPCPFACSAGVAPPPVATSVATFVRPLDAAPAAAIVAAPRRAIRGGAQPRAPPRFS